MKKFYLITWIILSIGFIMKLLHWTGGGALLSLSGILFLIHSIIHFIKFAKTNFSLSLLYLSFAVITIYLIGRIQYWGFVKPLFPIACYLVLAYLIVHLVYRREFHLAQTLLIIYFAFFFIISYAPAYEIYYFMNLNTFLNGDSRNRNYRCWDTYSWFLNLRREQAEALEANSKAKEAVKLNFKNPNDEEAVRYLNILKQHEQQIRDKDCGKDWLGYE